MNSVQDIEVDFERPLADDEDYEDKDELLLLLRSFLDECDYEDSFMEG